MIVDHTVCKFRWIKSKKKKKAKKIKKPKKGGGKK